MIKEISSRITGRVQGVLFRDFVQRKANGLDLVGFVENKDDGSVYVLVQGSEENLNRFIEHLHKGPFLAKVAKVDIVWQEPKESYRGFRIKY